jgi:eukaryotic-like serine/threonine-protein kinase
MRSFGMRLLSCSFVGWASAALAADATSFRAGAAHRGVFDGSAPQRLAGARWKFQTAGPIRSSPVVAGDRVFVGSDDGNLYAIDAASGREMWRLATGGGVSSTPAVDGDRVFVASRGGSLVACDRASGRERWRVRFDASLPLPWGWDFFDSSPAVADGRVIVGSGDGRIRCVAADTGKLVWDVATSGRVRSSPAIASGVVYCGSCDGRVRALDAATGKEVWTFATEGAGIDSSKVGFDRTSVQASPAVADGVLVVGARDGHEYALDAATGALRWKFDHEISWVVASAALDAGKSFVGSSDGHFFHCMDVASGKELWRFATPSNALSSPALSDGVVVFGCLDGNVFALDAATGGERWRFRTGDSVVSSPAVANGVVYVGSDDGALYALSGPAPNVKFVARRAVFWDEKLPGFWAGAAATRDYFDAAGYAKLDVAGLESFLRERTEDHAPSVVVFATDEAPPALVEKTGDDGPLVVRYLEAGGRIVWLGAPPFSIVRDAKSGGVIGMDLSAGKRILGVRTPQSFAEGKRSTPTADGKAWGLPDWWVGAMAIDPRDATTVLGLDEDGNASAWIKRFGERGTFVRLWGRSQPMPDLPLVKRIAEHALE